jgi:Spy/CpxP family protein refolding chaperone
MKNQLYRLAISGLLATGLTLGSAAVFAQAAPAPDASAPQQGTGQWGHQPKTPDEQVARMTKRYKLSSDQQAQIKPILANQQQQIQALRQDSTLSREDRMAKVKSIHEDSSSKIQAVLNDSQKQKFAQDQQRRQEHMQEHGAAPAGGPAA